MASVVGGTFYGDSMVRLAFYHERLEELAEELEELAEVQLLEKQGASIFTLIVVVFGRG